MRTKLKYLIFLFFLFACKNNSSDVKEERSLYVEPISIALNTGKGYSINLLTGDTIKPLINSLGDTIKTGVPLSLKEAEIDPEKISHPTMIKAIPVHTVTVASNIHPLPNKLKTFTADIAEYKSRRSDKRVITQFLPDSNRILTIEGPIPFEGERKTLREPQPIKALPLRFKDAATANIQYLDVSQGLNYSYIQSILEDRRGNLWFGLDGNGLCKYDGVHITTYTQKQGLPDNNVRSLMEDENGNLWIGSGSGVSIFDGKNFIQYENNNGSPGNDIYAITKDKKGNTWFRSESTGITKLEGKDLINYSLSRNLQNDKAIIFIADKNGSLWIGTQSGIARFDGNKITYFNLHSDILSKPVYAILDDRNGNVWFGSIQYGLIKFDGKSFIQFTKEDGLPDNSINVLMEDKKGDIWIGTRYGGVAKFNGNYFTNYSTEQGLSDNKIGCMAEDSQGNIWIGTQGGGVNKLNDDGFLQKIDLKYLSNSRVRPITKDSQGNLWLGTEAGGVYKYDGRSIAGYFTSDALPMHGLRSLLVDKKGNIWIGKTDGGGLYKYDGKEFFRYNTSAGLTYDNIFSILEDKNDDIWVATFNGGIMRLNGKKGIYYMEKEGFPSNNIYAIVADKKGNLWFGTEKGGLVKYDGSRFFVYSEKEGLFCKNITSIEEDKNGNIWLGTLGAGLCRFDGNSFTYYTEKQGLSYNDVWSIKEDSTGKIWVGTDKGLSLLIPQKDSNQKTNKNYSIYSFGLQEGLKATDFNLHSVCIDNNNRIWWGTGKALITCDLNTEFQKSKPRSLNLNYIEINGRFLDSRNQPDSTKKKIRFSSTGPFLNYPLGLKLNYDQNHLTFHFSAVDWLTPDKIKYSYRLIGSDATWSNPSQEAIADYRNLSHGQYEFQVRAIGQSQEWTQPFTYRFAIAPAWWQTWWFKAAVVLVTALFLLFISRFIYLYRLRKQKVLLEKQLAIQYERQRISAEMHDDVGAGLSAIKLLTELAKSKIADEQAATEMEKIHDSVGNISANMKEVIWSLDPENDTLENLITFIQKQIRRLLENYPCKLSIQIPKDIPDVTINGNDRRNIYLLVKEAVHNIIKHSGADLVTISIASSEQLSITISDNGKGLDLEKNKNTGNGMKNMHKRIQQLNGGFFVKSQNGLTLTFDIPFTTV